MVDVLIVAAAPPKRRNVAVEALAQLRARGATVRIACHFDPAPLALDPDLAETHDFSAAGNGAGLAFRAMAKGAEKTRRIWLTAQRDRWVREQAAAADVLVALDLDALYTVWQLAHRNQRADAVFGPTPAIKAVDRRLADPQTSVRRPVTPAPRRMATEARRRTEDMTRAVGIAATGQRAMRNRWARRAWRTVLSSPGLPAGPRGRLTLHVYDNMVRAGQKGSAAALADSVAPRIADPQVKSVLLGPAVDRALARGDVPPQLLEVAAGELAMAGASLPSHPGKATTLTGRAIDRLFHRVVQFDNLTSPLADDPPGYLEAFHESKVGGLLAARQGRSAPAASPPADRPLRLLFLTGINDNFLGPIRERYAARPDVEVRDLHMPFGSDQRAIIVNGRTRLIGHRFSATPNTTLAREARDFFGPHLEWADTVFVDWFSSAAAMLTVADPGSTRMIYRLHSYEAFSWWPHMMDYSRVDDVVFVSEHLRDFALEAVPSMSVAEAPRTHVLTNAMDLRRYPADKAPDARFALGLVGVGSIAKDPRWAIEVVRRLRELDGRYHLLIIGDDTSPDLSPATRRYRERYDADLAELEPAGAVRRLGQTDDVPAALREVGVILSSSVRESFHCALVEGAASGAVPVVRDWPFFARRAHGARTVFPSDWVVADVDAAVERIVAQTSSEEAWRAAGKAASEHALTTWDWSVTQAAYDEVFLGRG